MVVLIKSFQRTPKDSDMGIPTELSRLWRNAVISIVLPIVLSVFAAGGYSAEIESAIPARSVAHIVLRDVPRIWEEVVKSLSWQFLLSSEEMKGRVPEILTFVERVNGLLGVDLQSLTEVFGQRLALFQIGPDALGRPVIIADTSNSERAYETVQNIGQKLRYNGEYEVQLNAGIYKTIPFGLATSGGWQSTVTFAFLDNLFVLAPEQNTFEEVVDAYLGEEPSLAYDPRFNMMRSEVSLDGEVFVYVNLEILWPIIWSFSGTGQNMLLQMLDLHKIESVVWTTSLLAPTRDQEMYVYTGDSRGTQASLFAESKPLISPHQIPAADTDMFFATRLADPRTIWEKIGRAVRSVAGGKEHTQMLNSVSEFEAETGLSVDSDILSSLTGEIGFAISYPEPIKHFEGPEALLEAGSLVFCGVKDREKCSMSIERIFSAVSVQLQQTEYRGITVYQIPALSDSEIPVGYMFAGDLLIFGNLQRLEDVINEEPPLVVSEEFVKIHSRLPQDPVALYYADLEAVAGMLLGRNPEAYSEDDVARLQVLGSIGGTLIHSESGLKAKSTGTPGVGWLETMVDLATLLIHASL